MSTDCLELDALIDAARTGAPLAPEILRHLDGCARCRADYATLQAVSTELRAGADIPEAWIDHLIAQLPAAEAEDRRRRRERITSSIITGALGAVTVGGAAVVLQPGAPALQPSLPSVAFLMAMIAATSGALELRSFRTTLGS